MEEKTSQFDQKVVHVIAPENGMNQLIIKSGSSIIQPVPCLKSDLQLLYCTLNRFPNWEKNHKQFCLAWTDSMDFYVVVFTSDCPIIALNKVLMSGDDKMEGAKLLCRTKEYSALGYRSSWSYFSRLQWTQITQKFSQIIGYYPSPKIYSLNRSVRPTDDSEVELRLDRNVQDSDVVTIANWRNQYNEILRSSENEILTAASAESRSKLVEDLDNNNLSKTLNAVVKMKFYCFDKRCQVLRECSYSPNARFEMGAPKCKTCGAFC